MVDLRKLLLIKLSENYKKKHHVVPLVFYFKVCSAIRIKIISSSIVSLANIDNFQIALEMLTLKSYHKILF